MNQVIYALQFNGQAAPKNDEGTVLGAETSSPSSTIKTTVGAAGVSGGIERIDGDAASFVSEVRAGENGAFDEDGTITFGDGNSFEFETVGQGQMGPSPIEGITNGAVVWRIVSGTGQFDGAQGYITSNFTVDGDGKVCDNQFGVIFVE
jgi:hypothetical protein